jgi:protein SSD1
MEASSQSVQAESALFEDDDEEEDGQIKESAPTNLKSQQVAKSLQKVAPVFEDIEETSAGHCIQTVKELQTVPVIISSDLTVCPPVIKVFAVNPFN